MGSYVKKTLLIISEFRQLHLVHTYTKHIGFNDLIIRNFMTLKSHIRTRSTSHKTQMDTQPSSHLCSWQFCNFQRSIKPRIDIGSHLTTRNISASVILDSFRGMSSFTAEARVPGRQLFTAEHHVCIFQVISFLCFRWPRVPRTRNHLALGRIRNT